MIVYGFVYATHRPDTAISPDMVTLDVAVAHVEPKFAVSTRKIWSEYGMISFGRLFCVVVWHVLVMWPNMLTWPVWPACAPAEPIHTP